MRKSTKDKLTSSEVRIFYEGQQSQSKGSLAIAQSVKRSSNADLMSVTNYANLKNDGINTKSDNEAVSRTETEMTVMLGAEDVGELTFDQKEAQSAFNKSNEVI